MRTDAAKYWKIQEIARARSYREHARTTPEGRAAMYASADNANGHSATHAAQLICQISPMDFSNGERTQLARAIKCYRDLTNIGRYARKVSRA